MAEKACHKKNMFLIFPHLLLKKKCAKHSFTSFQFVGLEEGSWSGYGLKVPAFIFGKNPVVKTRSKISNLHSGMKSRTDENSALVQARTLAPENQLWLLNV